MRIGVCSKEIKADCAKQLFDSMAKCGCDVTQLRFGSVPEDYFELTRHIEFPGRVNKATIENLKNASRASGVDIGVVNGTFNMAHPEKAIRDEAVARFPYFLDAVKALGCDFVSLSTGSRSLVSLWAYSEENAKPDAWDDMMDTMARIIPIAKERDIILAVETEASNVVDTPQKAKRMLEEMNSPTIKMIMDCANLFRRGEARRELVRARIDEAFACYGDAVVIAHGKDVMEGEDLRFCAAGDGIVDFPYFLKKLREHDFGGDMLIHGVNDASRLSSAIDMLRKLSN